ncbi:MAG: helix-turn-helix transcriptional regulator [Lachnospiraceae bacterium]|nr:helix-turn-helix transcriptional regulator [Lachnospiraceae bacterium]
MAFTVEQARRLAKISQADMAQKLGMSEKTYRNKESGATRFYVDEADRFARLVGLPREDIIFLTTECQNMAQEERS